MYMHVLKRPVTAMTLIVAAIAAAFASILPANFSSSIGTSSPSAPAAAASPARGADAAALDIVKEQHVSLAQAELRLSWQRAVPSLNTALSRQLPAAAFGGTWIAPNDGDRVKVGVVGTDGRLRATVMRAVGAAGLSAAVDVVPVRYSAQQVVAADAWLSRQLGKLARAGSSQFPLDVAYRMDLNRVVLGVAGRSLTAAEQALVKRAKARYGDLVQVVTQPSGTAVGTALMGCTYPSGAAGAYPFCDAPLRGGITIWTNTTYQGAPAIYWCTGGFVATDNVTGQYYLLTAGHCPFYGGAGNWYTKFASDGSQHTIGTDQRYAFGGSADEAIININNPTGWMLPQGWVDAQGQNSTTNQNYPITSAQYSTQGARICETGQSSEYLKCGTVAALGQSFYECDIQNVNCVWVSNMGEATFQAGPGDSGGPVFASNQAFGLVSASHCYGVPCVPGTAYQGIIGAESALGVTIVLANNRPSPWPTGLQAVGVQGGVQLNWQDNSTNETSWIITDGVTNRYMNVSNGSTTGPVSYTWTGMGSHEWKCFSVSAYNAWGKSGPTPASGYVCTYSAT